MRRNATSTIIPSEHESSLFCCSCLMHRAFSITACPFAKRHLFVSLSIPIADDSSNATASVPFWYNIVVSEKCKQQLPKQPILAGPDRVLIPFTQRLQSVFKLKHISEQTRMCHPFIILCQQPVQRVHHHRQVNVHSRSSSLFIKTTEAASSQDSIQIMFH